MLSGHTTTSLPFSVYDFASLSLTTSFTKGYVFCVILFSGLLYDGAKI